MKRKILNKFRKTSYILLLVWVLVGIIGLFGGCSLKGHVHSSNYFSYTTVGRSGSYNILADDDTGVLYLHGFGGICPLFNADGTPRNISQFEGVS